MLTNAISGHSPGEAFDIGGLCIDDGKMTIYCMG